MQKEIIIRNGERYQITIDTDENPSSPREWDNLGIMACSHRNYNLGDMDVCSSKKIREDITELLNFAKYETWEEVEKYAKEELGALVVLPLYLYDHSGITMKTTPLFSRDWDSGQVGIIYTTKAQCDKLGTPTDDLEQLKKYLEGEVKTYDQYLTGEVYFYEVNKLITCSHGDEHEEFIGSCHEFYSEEGALQAAMDELPDEVTA